MTDVILQALITGVFSIANQLMSLNCLPPLKIQHTSPTHFGQIYVPVVSFYSYVHSFLCISYCSKIHCPWCRAIWGRILKRRWFLSFPVLRLHLVSQQFMGDEIVTSLGSACTGITNQHLDCANKLAMPSISLKAQSKWQSTDAESLLTRLSHLFWILHKSFASQNAAQCSW